MHTGNASASNAERNALTFLFFRFSPYVSSIFETASRILSYRRSVSSLLLLTLHESPFHRIYVCFEILPIGTYVSRLIGLPMQPLYYTLVCVSVSVHAHFLRFLSSPRPPPSYPPYLAYPSLILRIIDTGCYTCSMIGTSFRTNFLLVISLLHSFYMYYIIVTNENI